MQFYSFVIYYLLFLLYNIILPYLFVHSFIKHDQSHFHFLVMYFEFSIPILRNISLSLRTILLHDTRNIKMIRKIRILYFRLPFHRQRNKIDTASCSVLSFCLKKTNKLIISFHLLFPLVVLDRQHQFICLYSYFFFRKLL